MDEISEIKSVCEYIDEIQRITKTKELSISSMLSSYKEMKYYFEKNGEKIEFDKNNSQFLKYIDYIIESDGKATKKFLFFYRGHYRQEYLLIPSIYRNSHYNKEDFLYHEIMVRCPEHFTKKNHLDNLVTMQHYDCPTRLLDITANPLVALYFACKNYGVERRRNPNFGTVYIFPVEKSNIVYSDSDKVLMLTCLASLSYKDKDLLYNITMKSLNNNEFDSASTKYTDSIVEKFYHELTKEVPSFKRVIKPIDLLQPLFVQPNRTNGRILKQDGAFILNGLSKNDDEARMKLEAINCSKIKVNNQSQILKELDILGINEASLFPEIDKVAKYLSNR